MDARRLARTSPKRCCPSRPSRMAWRGSTPSAGYTARPRSAVPSASPCRRVGACSTWSRRRPGRDHGRTSRRRRGRDRRQQAATEPGQRARTRRSEGRDSQAGALIGVVRPDLSLGPLCNKRVDKRGSGSLCARFGWSNLQGLDPRVTRGLGVPVRAVARGARPGPIVLSTAAARRRNGGD